MRRPPDLATLRAAAWAYRALTNLRRNQRDRAPEAVQIVGPPPLPPHAQRGVRGTLRRANATCLESALVRQRWLAAQGDRQDLVIGVAGPTSSFRAHAWLEGDHPSDGEGYTELTRVPARGARP
jgi:hypothetical protein